MSFRKNLNKNNKYKNRIIMAAAYLIKYMNIILLSLIREIILYNIYRFKSYIKNALLLPFLSGSTLPTLIKY